MSTLRNSLREIDGSGRKGEKKIETSTVLALAEHPQSGLKWAGVALPLPLVGINRTETMIISFISATARDTEKGSAEGTRTTENGNIFRALFSGICGLAGFLLLALIHLLPRDSLAYSINTASTESVERRLSKFQLRIILSV